jgi:hypothetical protein
MFWGCISHDCKLDLVTIQGNLTGNQYIRDVLQPVVVPHFDNHLATRPVYMDDLSPADFRWFLTVLVDRHLLGSECCLSTGLVANGIRLTKRCNALSSRSDVTHGLPDLGKSFTLLVCVCFLTSRLTTV